MSHPRKTLLAAGLALLVQALNLTLVGPALARLEGEGAGNAGYVVLRVLVILGFAYGMTGFLGRDRFRAIAWVSLVELLTQVPIKGLYIHQLAQRDPGTWGHPELGSLTVGLGMGYAVFFPLVFGLAYVGAELGLRRSRSGGRGATSGQPIARPGL